MSRLASAGDILLNVFPFQMWHHLSGNKQISNGKRFITKKNFYDKEIFDQTLKIYRTVANLQAFPLNVDASISNS